MRVIKVDHIGVAVNSISDSIKLYTDILGLKVSGMEEVVEQKAKTAIISVGETKIELLESTSPDGAIAKHIERRGEGLHHIALEVDDIAETLDVLAKAGIVLVDSKPRKGVENSTIAFLHPKSTKILIEVMVPGK